MSSQRYLKSSQLSSEFLFYVMSVLLAITIYTFIVIQKYDIKDQVSEDKITHTLKEIRNLVKYVYLQGDGFFINYTLPYHLYFSNGLLILEENNITYTISLPLKFVNMSVKKGEKHIIKNEKGVIYVYPIE